MTEMKSDLSLPQQQLIKEMQKINFGWIRDMLVRNGEPVLDPVPRIIRKIKFCAENSPRSEIKKQDFMLKAPVYDLLTQIKALDNGTVLSLEIKHGLPFDMEVEKTADHNRG